MTVMNMREIVPWSRGGSRLPSIFGSEPASLLTSLHEEVNRLFDEVFRGFGLPATTAPRLGIGMGWPQVEIAETDKEVRLTFEVPGVEEKDIEVLLEDGDLVVRGEKRSEVEDKDRRFTERYYGRFERRIPLGDGVKEDAIRAEFRNGVLAVTVPKSARADQRVKRIPVNAAATPIAAAA